MPTDPSIDDEEPYASSEDSDFAPDDAPQPQSDQSDSEGEAPDASDKRQRPANDADAEADGYDNSGDEAIIERGKKKRKRAKGKAQHADDDEGGEGGLVKTRAQRAAEKEERKVTTSRGPVTVDVDALWAQMVAGETAQKTRDNIADNEPRPESQNGGSTTYNDADQEEQPTQATDEPSAMVKIKRTYNFAGQVHTEEKLVPRESAEAKLYLASNGEEPLTQSPPTKRITKRAFRSAFEPLVEPLQGRADLNLGMAARMKAAKDAQAKKLNTVEKSRMDWAGYVDKEGIKDELELAGKSKDSYAGRQDFLARSEALREDDARRARMAGRV